MRILAQGAVNGKNRGSTEREYATHPKEAAARLGITVMTLDAERSSGHLAYIQRKPGGKVWITEEAIAEYLARATHPARPELRRVKSLATRI